MPALPSHRARVLRHLEARQAQSIAAQVAAVRAWNAQHPIGTDVTYARDIGEPLHTKTRSAAQMLNNHSAVIWLDEVSGCVALERVTVRGTKP